MSIMDLWNKGVGFASEYSGITIACIVVLFSLIQITPVKLNPWSWVKKGLTKMMKRLGSVMTDESNKKLEELSAEVSSISTRVDENEIDRIRWELLAFANACQQGVGHTKNEFQHIFDLNKKYHVILERAGLQNGQVDREMEYIEYLYKKKEKEDSFLKC